MKEAVAYIPQAKMLRMFTLIELLAVGKHKIESLSTKLDQTPRTVYRYFRLLEEVGFVIEVDDAKRYFIRVDQAPAWVKVFGTNK